MNIQQMMKQAQALQMKVMMNGAHEIVSVAIAPEVVRPEETDLLEDLVLAACRDARSKVSAMVEEEMKKVTGGLGLPPGLF